MRIYIDAEFAEFGRDIDLISYGACDQNGRVFYAEANDFDIQKCSPWVKQNVLNQLGTVPSMTSNEIADTFALWVAMSLTKEDNRPQFWGYFAAWDWMLTCQLYDGFMDLPSGWPQNVMDIVQESIRLGVRIPAQQTERHRADRDAIWTKESHDFLIEYEEDLKRQNRFRVNGRTVQINGGEVERIDVLR